MKILRPLTVLFALTLAPFAFAATVTNQGSEPATYVDNGTTMTLAPGESIEIPDNSTFELVRGAISVSGSATVDVGNGTAEVSGGTMFVEVSGDRARVTNLPGSGGQVTFVKPNGEQTTVAPGSEIFSAVAGADTLVILVEDVGTTELPGFDVDPVVGTPL